MLIHIEQGLMLRFKIFFFQVTLQTINKHTSNKLCTFSCFIRVSTYEIRTYTDQINNNSVFIPNANRKWYSYKINEKNK